MRDLNFLLFIVLFFGVTTFTLKAADVYKSSSGQYVFNSNRGLLISREPVWFRHLENVCSVQFADYRNKDDDIVPVLFVAYNDGRAAFFVLPVKGENECLYYQFDREFEPREDKVCYIFDGKETDKKNRPFIYFRVVDKHGEAVNYAVYEGDF